jgi:hypothetical protein
VQSFAFLFDRVLLLFLKSLVYIWIREWKRVEMLGEYIHYCKGTRQAEIKSRLLCKHKTYLDSLWSFESGNHSFSCVLWSSWSGYLNDHMEKIANTHAEASQRSGAVRHCGEQPNKTKSESKISRVVRVKSHEYTYSNSHTKSEWRSVEPYWGNRTLLSSEFWGLWLTIASLTMWCERALCIL